MQHINYNNHIHYYTSKIVHHKQDCASQARLCITITWCQKNS